ncbi:TPA: hypothetical protein ACIS09_003132 [Salmonella enterica subsp. enterica serovar Birkenhead]
MKLSPEARQAIKTSIEQLHLLLVDDAMDTVREEVSKHWMDDGKDESEKITLSGDCRMKITGNSESNRQVVLEASELKVSNSGQSARLIQSANFHSFKRIYAELDKLTEEVKTLRSSNKKLKKRVSTLEKWEKIHR